MTEHQICAPTLHELTPGTDPSGSAEELALAALQRRIETNQVADELLPIADDEITTRDASRFPTSFATTKPANVHLPTPEP
jgi:hypothetical protein